MLIDSNFAFFIYTVPYHVLVCMVLLLLFLSIHKYEISKHVRKFYFIKAVVTIVLLEENLGYFVFVCFSHLRLSFTFNLADKLSLSLTLVFLFSLFFFTFCFYFLLSRYLRKRVSYFAELTYP